MLSKIKNSKSIYDVRLNLQELRIDMDKVEERINTAFYVDMFLAISRMEGIQPRNELDLLTRNEEKLLQLGPVLERMEADWLSPLIDRQFNQGLRAGIFPTPPDELQGAPLRIRYISQLAMAQRAVATQGIDRLTAYVAGLAEMGKEDALDKFDGDQAIDEYGKAIGVPPTIIVPDDRVAQIRQQRAEQQARQAAIEQAQIAANAAKMAADAKTGDANVLTDIAGAANG